MLLKNLRENMAVTKKLLKSERFLAEFNKAANAIKYCLEAGGRIYIAGNGGSASDSQHLAAEFVGRYKRERTSLAAESLSSDMATVTAIGNDYGYDQVFRRQLQGKMRSNDVFLAISTSGNSSNIVEALKYTDHSNFVSILLTGKDGGAAELHRLAEIVLKIPSEETSVIQQQHVVVYHSLIEQVEEWLGGE
jgi:D-sedoheptulose 7-phosphate isomerase